MHTDFENAICARSRLVLGKVSLASNKKLNPNRVPWYCALVIG
ncbi:transcription factor 8, isoform CRA_b [Rattus norvegicus]|uniref:Transcription factor 8, isoform CRA_b n=1 Tax=Rattus norvegicus TaxID=10116 RepID=A6K9E5_RAT|nr:transcription factor 8, isoform CRA_b [Rattus norvegicus]